MDAKKERCLVLIKPDGVLRSLIGEIIARFEKCGLKVVGLGMVWPKREDIDNHYPKEEAWLRKIGEKTLKNYEKYGIDPQQELGTSDTLEIGKMVREWLLDYMTKAPIVKVALEGNHAADVVRKIVGDTLPLNSSPGTLRGDFSVEDAGLANREKRAIYNLIHASENSEEAEREIKVWFKEEELFDYKNLLDKLYE
ncbi:Nucleoside diphosphate kinase [bacterium HR34]|nr:Nucleoside diphosphate kinase [bacterium HR34]